MSGEVIKVVAIIIIAAVFITALRSRLGEFSFILALAVVSVVLIFVLANLVTSITELRDLVLKSGNSTMYFTVALKALGISYISTFAADLCRDFGLSALAQTAETSGKIAIFALSIPLISAVLQAAIKFVGL